MSRDASSKSVAPPSPEAWAQQPFLAAIRDELTGRFIANPPPLYTGDDITFYEAIRRAAGLDPALGLVAWRNHVELGIALADLHHRLDWALVTRLGGNGRAEPWALGVDRTEQEVLALLVAATDPACELPDAVIPNAEQRLLPPGIVGIGKYRGAIACQLAALRVQADVGYGPLIDRMLKDSGPTDRNLLEWLDGRCTDAIVDVGRFPGKLTDVAGKWLGKNAGGTMARFLQTVADDWAPLSDDQAIALLHGFNPATRAPALSWAEESALVT